MKSIINIKQILNRTSNSAIISELSKESVKFQTCVSVNEC